MKDCRGDAQYGPLLFLEGNDASIELELLPDASTSTVHALATLYGRGGAVAIKAAPSKPRATPLPILLGVTPPPAGQGMAEYGARPAIGLRLRNETTMPIRFGTKSERCVVETDGEISDDSGKANTTSRISTARDQRSFGEK
ncbi:MAG: hypothetical protein QM811_24155 [Pirellulales bacterium]